MAKIYFYPDPSIPQLDAEAILAIYEEMVTSVSKKLVVRSDFPEGLPDSVVKELMQSASENMEWKITVNRGSAGSYEIWIRSAGGGVGIKRVVYPQDGLMKNDFFEISGKYQKRNISKDVMLASLKLADQFKAGKIGVNANLDVGGYVWLRKGAWPNSGKEGFLEIISSRKWKNEDRIKLAKQFEKFAGAMSEKELKLFVLSPEFSQYRDLFLGSDWDGYFDVNDPIVRAALGTSTEEAYALAMRTTPDLKPSNLTANEKIFDEFLKHQIRVLRYARTLSESSMVILNKSEEQLQEVITKYQSKLEGLDYTSANGKKLLRELEAAIYAVRSKQWEAVNKNIIKEMDSFAVAEGNFSAMVIEGAIPATLNLVIPNETYLKRIAQSTPFEGAVLSEWLKSNQDYDIARISRVAKQGIVDGLTPAQVARNVFGTEALKRGDGVARKALNNIEAVVSTATSTIQNQVREQIYKENPEVVSEEYFIATLDINTTFECAGYDGEIFKVGSGPIPPLHFRCRSLRGAYINPEAWRNRGFDANTESSLLKAFSKANDLPQYKDRDSLPKGFKTKYDAFAREEKYKLIGEVPAKTTFSKWLKNQSADFQREYLGPVRYEAFSKGQFTITDFTNTNGKTYTLEQLGLNG